jgi:RHS repeat-associated protein
VYDASNRLVAEYSTIAEPAATAKTSYLTNDHLGSPRITTDALGQVASRRDLMPYGEEIQRQNQGSDSVRQKFTSYERDIETDLDFAQARMYGYNHGRFTSPDPTLLSVNAYNPQSWNRYIYVLNNPHLYTDPLGLWEITTQTVCKKNDDGTCKTYKNGEVKVDRVIVTARKTKDDDDAARLAQQLGLTGKEAEKFAEKIGDADNIQLSEQGGLIGRVFDAVEDGLTQQANWINENKEKLDKLEAKGQYGPGNNDCSGTSCRIGLGDNIPLIGTNILDPRLDTEARNIAESEAQVGDIIRYAKADNIATHFANFIFRNDDGTPVAFSKSGVKGPYEIRSAASLQVPLYGTIRGRNKDSSGYYRRR